MTIHNSNALHVKIHFPYLKLETNLDNETKDVINFKEIDVLSQKIQTEHDKYT